MPCHTLARTQCVAAPLDEVFPFFATPENLETITPPLLRFEMLTPRPVEMREGALFDYAIRTRGVPLRWTTLITKYEPPHRFVDVQLRGPYGYWHHTHTFAETADGGTSIGDEILYQMPFGPLGRLAHWAVVRRDLERIFAYRRQVIAERFGAR